MMTATPAPIPDLVPEQIAACQGDALIIQPVLPFEVAHAAAQLRSMPRRTVLALDIGGDKLRVACYTVGDGHVEKENETVHRSRGGIGYLDLLQRIATDAAERDTPVGISSATKLEGSVITRTVNLPALFADLSDHYAADYRRLFSSRAAVANDTVMGVIGVAARLALAGTAPTHLAFIICASGMGGAVIADGTASHVEVGHVPVDPRLNPLSQTTPCGVEGRTYVCVERIAAARAGIEDIWHQHTGEALDGVGIAARLAAGDPMAALLYRASAIAVAHAAAGTAQRFGFPAGETSVIALHGGNTEVPAWRDTLLATLTRIPQFDARVVFSRDISANVCLDGAAVMAALTG